jgi:hypothetical protein
MVPNAEDGMHLVHVSRGANNGNVRKLCSARTKYTVLQNYVYTASAKVRT